MNSNEETRTVLDHWREAVPDDRLAHLVKDATRALVRGLQMRLTEHDVSFGHWAFLRILWESDGLTQRELSEQAGVQEPTTFSAMKAMEALGYVERKHPFSTATLSDQDMSIDFAHYAEPDDHVAVVVTAPLTTNEHWTSFAPGELGVFVDGARVG